MSELRETETETVLDLLTDSLASYRLTKLIRDDFITQPLRDAVYERSGPPHRSKLSYLVNCPWCLSIYFGFILALARRRAPGLATVVSRSLAVSALTGLLAEKAACQPRAAAVSGPRLLGQP
jgi:hypothetical protein